ncbi:MAG: hypothetical protein V1867_04245 [Candidatus Falkowbacteria bacterium]
MKRKQIIFFFGALALLSFFLNLGWEAAHSFLYNWNQPPLKPDAGFYILRILQSTFFDMVWIVIISGLVFFTAGFKLDRRGYAFIFGGLLAFSFGLEWHRILEGAWHYKNSMPTLEDLGLRFPVGLSPLVQLAITGIVSVNIIQRLSGRAE